jgi:hypothetical protein
MKMYKNRLLTTAVIAASFMLCAQVNLANATGTIDPSTIQPSTPPPPPPAAPAITPNDSTEVAPVDPSAPDAQGGETDGLSIGEIPAVDTEELTADMARKALDAYVVVHVKYQDSPLENYDDLQAFVDKDPKGKEFEADVKAFGFKDVNDWNLAITTLSFTFTNVLDDQTADYKQQIDEVNADTEMAQDMKDRMVKSLKALIPSPNNQKIVEDLIADPVYGEKIKQLESSEE